MMAGLAESKKKDRQGPTARRPCSAFSVLLGAQQPALSVRSPLVERREGRFRVWRLALRMVEAASSEPSAQCPEAVRGPATRGRSCSGARLPSDQGQHLRATVACRGDSRLDSDL